MRVGGAPNSFTRSCDQTSRPVALANACICLLVPAVKTRLPTTSGDACGPAPYRKLSGSDGYLYSHSVSPVAAFSAMTDSAASQDPGLGNSFPERYIVNRRPSSTAIDECPNPSGRLHRILGP